MVYLEVNGAIFGTINFFFTKEFSSCSWVKGMKHIFFSLIRNQFFFFFYDIYFFPKFRGSLPLGGLRQWPNWPSGRVGPDLVVHKAK